jgi:hypothetical protein
VVLTGYPAASSRFAAAVVARSMTAWSELAVVNHIEFPAPGVPSRRSSTCDGK